MGEFYTSAKRTKILSLLRGFGFTFKQSGKHIKAFCPKTGDWTLIPRSNELKNGTVESICDFLVERGYDTVKIKKALR